MQEQCRSIRHLLMYSATVIMQQHVLDWQMQVTFTDVLQTLRKTFSKKRIAALEGGVAALAVASGAAAVTYTIENLAQNGDHIVAAKNIYGGSFNLLEHTLPQYGITTTFVDIFDYDAVEAAIQDNTKALYIETLGNPNSDVVDIEKIANIAHAHKIPLVVDNTFATPYLVRPIEYGADIVIHSATKFIGGHGTTIGGGHR